MRSWSPGFPGPLWLVLMMPLVGAGMVATVADAQPIEVRPFVIKPDGVVLRPNAGIRCPDLDTAWDAYAQITDDSVRRLADQCFEDERQKLLQDGVLPVIPRDAVGTYWAEVNAAKANLHDAYTKHSDPLAMKEWVTDVASQVPCRFPEDGDYLLVEDQVTRRGRVIRVHGDRVAWDLHHRMPDGSVRVVPGKAVPLPSKDGGAPMKLHGLVNPENGKKITVSIDCLLQSYELHLTEPDGRHIAEIAGRVVPLSGP
ncbi:MAG: hypothetical protein ACKO40_04825 [Planctomycetaceae bacterium]